MRHPASYPVTWIRDDVFDGSYANRADDGHISTPQLKCQIRVRRLDKLELYPTAGQGGDRDRSRLDDGQNGQCTPADCECLVRQRFHFATIESNSLTTTSARLLRPQRIRNEAHFIEKGGDLSTTWRDFHQEAIQSRMTSMSPSCKQGVNVARGVAAYCTFPRPTTGQMSTTSPSRTMCICSYMWIVPQA